MSRYLTSAVEQALWSLLQLGLNLLLLRLIAPEQYGAFAFWANCGFVLSSAQNALSVTHLMVLAPGDDRDPARAAVERLMLAVSLIGWIVCGLLAGAAILLLQAGGSPLASPAAALFLPAFLIQQYARSLSFSRGRVADAAVQTGTVLVLTTALLVLAAIAGVLTADTVMLAMALGYGLVGVVALVRAQRGMLRGFGPSLLKGYGAYLKPSGWIFLGVGSTEVLTRFYAFAVAALHGPAALAALSAAQLLLRPIPLLATTWAVVARSEMASAREANDPAAISKLVLVALGCGLVIAAAWTATVYLMWPLISHWLFGGKYAGDAWMVPLWGLAAALSFGQTAVSIALQILRAFKALALANTAAAGVAIIALVLLMRAYGPGGAILGTAIGQGLELVAMAVVLGVWLRRMRRDD